jgi:SNF2 family DNA or RNA helicase
MVNELQSFSPRFKILLYKSKGAQDIGSAPTIKDELTKEHTIFDASKDINARTIVITTYQTLAQRHGPKACEAWCLQNNIHWKIANKIVLPPSSWPGLINGKFEIVFADECQHAKNIEANQWNTIHWLKPRFIVLSSATPLYAGINDMQAYLLLMEPSASVKDWQRKPTDSPYRPGLDSPYNLPEDHSAVVHRLYRSSFEKFVLSTPDP